MTFALTLAAIRRHPFGVIFTTLLAIVTASLLGVSTPLALGLWIVTSLTSLELWYAVEPLAMRRLGGCRTPTAAEQQRLEAVLGRSHTELLIAENAELTTVRGLRCLAIGRDVMDVLEDRALVGFLAQAAAQPHTANLAGCMLVWLGNAPLLVAWWTSRLVSQLGRLLALAIGASLVLPLIVCRDAYLRWAGLVLTSLLVGLCGTVLLSYGLAAAGAGLLLAWLLVPGLRTVLAWESRRAERSADQATIEAGFGLQLLEAVDFLALIEPCRPTSGLLSILSLPGSSMIERGRRLRRQLMPSNGSGS
jgi:hypothetical protein